MFVTIYGSRNRTVVNHELLLTWLDWGVLKLYLDGKSLHLQTLAEGSQKGDDARGETTETESSEESGNARSDSGKETDAEATVELGELGRSNVLGDTGGVWGCRDDLLKVLLKSELLEDTSNTVDDLANDLSVHAGNISLLGDVKVLDVLDVQLLEDGGGTGDGLLNHLGGEARNLWHSGEVALQVVAESGEGASKTRGEATETETSDQGADGSGEIGKESGLDTGSLEVGEVSDLLCWEVASGEVTGGKVTSGKVTSGRQEAWGGSRSGEGRANQAEGGSQGVSELHCCEVWVVILKNIDNNVLIKSVGVGKTKFVL